jgi:hypothetical protein
MISMRMRARALLRALALAHVLDRDLDAQQVDASGADLSGMEITHLDALNGIVWTHQTVWPPRIADQVQAHSQEIRPGVYQVRLGDRPDRYVPIPV